MSKKPFDLDEIRKILPELQPQHDDPDYTDWEYCNWGLTDIPPEREPYKARVTLVHASRRVLWTVHVIDDCGEALPVTDDAREWAGETVAPLVKELLEYEGTTEVPRA